MADLGFVGVAVEDGGEFGGGGVEAEVPNIVKHVDVGAFKEHDFSFGQAAAAACAVDVAADGGERRDGGEGVEDFGVADVAEVEDGVDALEKGENFGAEQAVGVTEDGDLQWVSLLCLSDGG